MKRLTAQLVPAAELRRARDYLLGQLDLSLENSENQMMWAGEQWLGYGKIVHPGRIQKAFERRHRRQVRAAARDFFRPDASTWRSSAP
jgi:predicted Zn-dependent peptidase